MNAALMLQNATMRERLAKLNTKGSAIQNSQATVLERIRQCGLHVAEIIGSRLEAPDRPQATGAVQGLVSGLIGWLGADRPVVAPWPVPVLARTPAIPWPKPLPTYPLLRPLERRFLAHRRACSAGEPPKASCK